jgi:sialic acid synthase SpsE
MAYEYPTWPGWPGRRTAVVAEVGMNHGGDPRLAWKMIQVAHEHGADFVKLQTFRTENLLHPSLDYYDGTRRLELSESAQEDLFTRARDAGIALVTTPFDQGSLDVAERFDPPFHKVASMDVDNLPHLERVAQTGRPVIVSCGMSNLGEMETVTRVMRECSNDKLVLLQCVSDYPADEASLNLSMIPLLRDVFRLPVGLSDHTIGLNGAFVAASLGAAVIEKHFTLDRSMADSMPDADHGLSVVPEELRRLRRFCDAVPVVMGRAPRSLTEDEQAGRRAYRRGLYAKRDIAAGDVLDLDNVSFLRPVAGIPAGAWNVVHGRKITSAIGAGQPILYTHVGL